MTKTDALATVKEGHLVHAEGDRGASMLLHVVAITENTIETRRLLTGGTESFNKRTGRGSRSQLNSIAALPPDIHETIYNLDRRHRSRANVDDAKLTRAERDALVFLHHFYTANPLPED